MRKEAQIDRNVLWEKVGYKPHGPEQLEFHNSNARFRAPICGRRFGKSTMAAQDLIEAMFIPDTIYWICGPTYKLAEKEFRIVYNAFHDKRKLNFGSKCKASYNVKQGDMRILFKPTNSLVECVSATNQDSLLGEGLSGVIMSESAEHKKETWEKYVEPAISDLRGWASFPTTPNGFNWIHALYQLGQDPSQPDYFSQCYPTWLNTFRYEGGFDPVNCFVETAGGEKLYHVYPFCKCNDELVRIWRRASPAFWNQMYAALFTSVQGSIYDEFTERTHVREIPYNPAWRNFVVFDWGFSAPLVCLDIMVDPDDNFYVWREYQESWLTTRDHGFRIINRDNPEGYHIDGAFGDPSNPDAYYTMAQVIGQPVFAEKQPWDIGIEAVKRQLKIQDNGLPKLLIDPSCHKLITQMQALRRRPETEDKNPREGQVDYNDHAPDALRYFHYYFLVLGYGESLSDMYDGYKGSESETFFNLTTGIQLDRDHSLF